MLFVSIFSIISSIVLKFGGIFKLGLEHHMPFLSIEKGPIREFEKIIFHGILRKQQLRADACGLTKLSPRRGSPTELGSKLDLNLAIPLKIIIQETMLYGGALNEFIRYMSHG